MNTQKEPYNRGGMDRPLVAITMGDPAGIGPEVTVKTLANRSVHTICRPLVVGDLQVLENANRLVDSPLTFRTVQHISRAVTAREEIGVLVPAGLRVEHVVWGQVDGETGKAAALCLAEAAALALAGSVDAVVSAPMSKEAFHLAGYEYPDEPAFLADLTGSLEPFLMGIANGVWTVTVTEHIPFREIAAAVTSERILTRIRQLDRTLRRAGCERPRIGVAALNVHAGDGGLFGREEIEQITPAINEAQRASIAAEGPIPADAIFPRAFAGEFEGVVCMYHDQANIARKLQPFETGTTMFMGLPIVCSTTAHGTALDKAGKGIADARGLETALRWAVRLAAKTQPAH
jgi:4-hydroxythreonine-4-phosphate dehydrogenase